MIDLNSLYIEQYITFSVRGIFMFSFFFLQVGACLKWTHIKKFYFLNLSMLNAG